MRDKELISKIRKGKRDIAIKQLYREYPKVKANIISSGGDSEIAQEIFNDSLLILIEKVSEPTFELSSKLTTYLYGIARFLWKNEARKRNKNPELEWKDTLIISADDLDYNAEKELQIKQLESVLNSLSEKCQQIFELFYYKQDSMQMIAKKLNFSSANSVKTQKYKCMERAVKIAKELKNQ
jgi:RNA polymerase sigma factor (sigma-70 family)